MGRNGEQLLIKLNQAGFKAYYVGGCVRDMVLGKIPKDIDITTDALPDEVEALFDKTIPTGKDYGTITVLEEGNSYEVTTFRLDLDYDGRRPKAIAFSKRLEDDLCRRDFTMNAMAMDIEGTIIDPFGGQTDLKAGVLRFVGIPSERIREDKIRMLRYVRFLSTYGLAQADPSFGLDSIVDITTLSAERIREEFNKILMSERAAEGIRMLSKYHLLEQFFPELSRCQGFEQHHPAHSENVFDHTMTVLSRCEPNLLLRISALCHDLGKVETQTFDEEGIGHFYGHQKNSVDLAQAMMTRLKYSAREIETVKIIVNHHMRIYDAITKPAARRLINHVGVDYLDLLFKLQAADTGSCSGDREVSLNQIQSMRALCYQLIEENQAFSLKNLAVNGNDLMALGIYGKEIGLLLNHLLEMVISETVGNDKDLLLEEAKQVIKNK